MDGIRLHDRDGPCKPREPRLLRAPGVVDLGHRDIIAKLNAVIVKDLAETATRERLLGQGLDPIGNSPEAFSKLLREELPKWGKVVKISGAKVD